MCVGVQLGFDCVVFCGCVESVLAFDVFNLLLRHTWVWCTHFLKIYFLNAFLRCTGRPNEVSRRGKSRDAQLIRLQKRARKT